MDKHDTLRERLRQIRRKLKTEKMEKKKSSSSPPPSSSSPPPSSSLPYFIESPPESPTVSLSPPPTTPEQTNSINSIDPVIPHSDLAPVSELDLSQESPLPDLSPPLENNENKQNNENNENKETRKSGIMGVVYRVFGWK